MMAEPSEDSAVVELEGIRKSFGEKHVLREVDLRVSGGETLAVLGHSGTGKSVLLKLAIGLLEPDAGTVRLWGRSVAGQSEDAWRPFRRRMGLVFQSGALFDSMSVGENVAFPLLERGEAPGPELDRRVEECLEWVELPGVGAMRPSELSGGMRKRVALARTLAGEPELILFDEPTTGLDPVTGHTISCLIRDMSRKIRATSIVVTHDVDCARTVAERWAFLHEGGILADGEPAELFASEDAAVRQFLALWASMGIGASGSAEESP